ncbi:hypothetical protein GOBAR_AA02869 [Gossypium barbadense]|uniref:NAC domain-containing protein n=1 Tax=Gossypium barbadense TaxID=3634 RepID=A0A2P5YQ57_GOSBA|nr:hypothetical protein GOBAR_AA02869 [Gossypium barbadense]
MQEVWTLCRIFKRTPPNNKYPPTTVASTAAWKFSATTTIKQNGTDYPTTCRSSMEDVSQSQNSYDKCKSLCDTVIQQKGNKPDMDEVDARNYFLYGGTLPLSTQQAPFTSTNFPTFCNHPNGDVDVFSNGNWDELRPVVEEVWTLCRIFKRTPPNNKYPPTTVASTAAWKFSATTTIKQNGTDYPTTCRSSMEDVSQSQNSYDKCKSLCDTVIQQKGNKPDMDEVDARNYFLYGGTLPLSTQQAPFTSTNFPTFCNHPNGDVDVFSNGNWDELRPVVEVALEPYTSHAFDYT